MSSTLRYDYDIPWRGVAIGVGFNLGISLLMVHWAISIGGILSIAPIFLGAVFALLALWMIVRRLVFSRVLELTDDAILFPSGLTGKRTTRVAYSDIMRMQNLWIKPGLRLRTAKKYFEISSVRFTSMEDYCAVRNCVCSKTSILLPEDKLSTWDSGWVPGPILKWSEPEDYVRYQTCIATSKPLWLRLAKAIRFFVCFFGFFFIPWLALNYFLDWGASASAFLAVLIPVSLFFTLLHWLSAYCSARVSHITVFSDSIHELSGKQMRDLSFEDSSGWSVVEREFEGRILHILLMQRPKWVHEVALPDINTRDRFVQMLNEKKIPQVSNLKPSWELKP